MERREALAQFLQLRSLVAEGGQHFFGQVVDRAAITAHVWDENHDPFTNVLEVLVRRLRRKIDDDFPVKLIQTVRGSGYRFGD